MEKEVVYVAEHIRMYQIDWLAVNGGFVRANIATFGLDKFKGKNAFRTFNLNYDVASSDAVLRADEEHISHIVLVGKNVCHDARNTRNGLWGGKYKELFDEYRVKDEKRQHDLLVCHEGLAFLQNTNKICEYETVRPYNTGLNGKLTQWGSTKTMETPYREVLAAVGYMD